MDVRLRVHAGLDLKMLSSRRVVSRLEQVHTNLSIETLVSVVSKTALVHFKLIAKYGGTAGMLHWEDNNFKGI
jgi:hypothetical protein